MKVIASRPSIPPPLALTCLLAPHHFLSHDSRTRPDTMVAAVNGGERRSP
jgi:hypothetical protein